MPEPEYPDPREEGINIGNRRASRPDSVQPGWHIPEAVYHTVPIAWFAAAFMLQLVVLTILFVMLLETSGCVTIMLTGLATLALGVWPWERGMRTASRGWQTATVLVPGLQFAPVCLRAAPRL
jgi:hypothetical protein